MPHGLALGTSSRSPHAPAFVLPGAGIVLALASIALLGSMSTAPVPRTRAPLQPLPVVPGARNAAPGSARKHGSATFPARSAAEPRPAVASFGRAAPRRGRSGHARPRGRPGARPDRAPPRDRQGHDDERPGRGRDRRATPRPPVRRGRRGARPEDGAPRPARDLQGQPEGSHHAGSSPRPSRPRAAPTASSRSTLSARNGSLSPIARPYIQRIATSDADEVVQAKAKAALAGPRG